MLYPYPQRKRLGFHFNILIMQKLKDISGRMTRGQYKRFCLQGFAGVQFNTCQGFFFYDEIHQLFFKQNFSTAFYDPFSYCSYDLR